MIATRSAGTIQWLIEQRAIRGVDAGDAGGLRAAILGLLQDRASAQAQAERGYRLVLERFDSERVVEELAARLGSVAGGDPRSPRAAPASAEPIGVSASGARPFAVGPGDGTRSR